MKEPKTDYWTDDGCFFVTGGLKFGVTSNGGTVVVEGMLQDRPPDSPDNALDRQSDVSKIPDKEIIPTPNIQAQDNGIMKQRGRPRKTGEVSRVTVWRRQKQQQGVLL